MHWSVFIKLSYDEQSGRFVRRFVLHGRLMQTESIRNNNSNNYNKITDNQLLIRMVSKIIVCKWKLCVVYEPIMRCSGISVRFSKARMIQKICLTAVKAERSRIKPLSRLCNKIWTVTLLLCMTFDFIVFVGRSYRRCMCWTMTVCVALTLLPVIRCIMKLTWQRFTKRYDRVFVKVR